MLPFCGAGNRLVVCHLNIRSFTPKYEQMYALLGECSQQGLVFGLSETWLDKGITDSEINIPGYNIHHRDRERKGGEILVYVSQRTYQSQAQRRFGR